MPFLLDLPTTWSLPAPIPPCPISPITAFTCSGRCRQLWWRIRNAASLCSITPKMVPDGVCAVGRHSATGDKSYSVAKCWEELPKPAQNSAVKHIELQGLWRRNPILEWKVQSLLNCYVCFFLMLQNAVPLLKLHARSVLTFLEECTSEGSYW